MFGDTLQNKTILITGGAGFLGSAIVKRLCQGNKVIVLDKNVSSISNISSCCNIELGAIEDGMFVNQIFSKYRPDIVFHCASIKDVEQCEKSPTLALQVNVLGTINLLQAADKNSCESFIFVSSVLADQATSMYGMTKNLCEKLIGFLSNSTCKFISCRLCNIYGSPGSVVDIFRNKIASKETLRIKQNEYRTFMSLDTAIDFLIDAYITGKQGELRVCESGIRCSIEDVAKRVCSEFGLTISDVNVELISK